MRSNPEFLISLFRDIAPAQSMQITITDYSSHRLELAAPLQPNINDKGTAFAGSISSMLVLAGWGLITRCLRDAGIKAEVVVAKSETTYNRPVRAAMCSIAEINTEQSDRLISELAKKPRASIRIETKLISEGKPCATMSAHYVAFQAL
jgi:thioesterase domain-containing protein